MMKKVIVFVTILLSFILVGCSEEKTPMEEFIVELNLNEPLNESITIPDSYEEFAVSFESSNPDILSNTGFLNQASIPENGTSVDLMFTLSSDDETYEETLSVQVEQSGAPFIVNQRTLQFESLASEYLLDDSEIELNYSQYEGMPFVDVESFLTLLDGGESQGAIDLEYFEFQRDGAILTLELVDLEEDEEDIDDGDVVMDDDVDRILEIDFESNTLTVTSFDFFRAFSESTQTDFGEDLELYDYDLEVGEAVTMDLNAYDLSLIYQDEGYYMPFHLANLFFSGMMYDVYYNGDMVYGFDTYQGTASGFGSNLRSSDYYDTISDTLLEESYNYMVFTFDYFYGLKDDQGVSTYYDEFSKEAFMDSNGHTDAVFETVYALDDLHTSFLMSGMFDPYYDRDADMSEGRTGGFYESYQYLFDEDLCRSGIRYLDDDSIAVISIGGFESRTPQSFSNALDIIDNRGTVDDIVVDLSCNTGGVVGTMIQVLGYMTDEPLPFYSINPTDGARSTTWYTSEVEARDEYEWHILSSPVSYSAANMMISIANDLDIANIIGENSAGGAASITTNILPSGTTIIMSSTSVSANKDYDSIEMGVEVDEFIPLESFDDDSKLIDAIR